MTGGALRRAAALCGALACVLAVLAGCGGPPARSGGDPAAIQSMLDVRARAVLRHDRAAFLGTVDPAASAFRAGQRRVFDNLGAVPFASWTYRLQRTGAFPLAPAADGTRRVAAQVELDYRLRDYDTAPVSSPAYVTVDLRAGHWYVASLSDGEPAGRRTTAQPWDLGPVTVVRGAASLVLGTGTAPALRAYARLADRAVPAVGRAWGGGPPVRAVVEVPGSTAQLVALLGAPPSAAPTYRDIAAVTWAELRGSGAAPADRVIVNPEAFAELSPVGRQVVMAHEITHVATRDATTERTPLWLVEGFADWVGYSGTAFTPRQAAPELAADVAAGRTPRRLPSQADFTPGGPRLAQAYEESWLACRMIAGQWGSGALVRLYRTAGGQGADAALRSALGLDTGAFEARWSAYVAKELG